jgi:hypothetical protein
VPTDRYVAQRNLSVVLANRGLFRFAFEIHNLGRTAGVFTVRARQGTLRQLEKLKGLLGRDFTLPKQEGRVGRLGFVRSPCPDAAAADGAAPQSEGPEASPAGPRRL